MGGGGSAWAAVAAAGRAACRYSVQTKRANLPAVLEILRQVLREPTLPESEFEVMKNERLAGLEQGRSDPMRLGINRLQRLLSHYPSDDVRYVPTIDEQIDRLKEVTRRQSPLALSRLSGAGHGELVDRRRLRASETLPVLAQTFEGWKSRNPTPASNGRSSPISKPERETILTPDKANACYLRGLDPPDEGQRSRLSRPGRRQLHPGRRRDLVAHRRSASPEGRPLLQRRGELLRQPARSARQLADHGDLQPRQRHQSRHRRR